MVEFWTKLLLVARHRLRSLESPNFATRSPATQRVLWSIAEALP